MGGGNYDRDVEDIPSTREEVFDHNVYLDQDTERRECHPDLNPRGQVRECRESEEHQDVTPIVVVMDVTRSRGEDAVVVFNKMPLLIGQINMKGYAPHPEICIAAVGDATSGDFAPLQVGQFESDTRIDEDLSKVWLEEKGGGTGQESYELAAYYFARKTELDCLKRGKKGYLFITGDEGFYPKVAKDQIKTLIGDDIPDDISSEQIFKELQEKYHVFFIYPKKTWQERKDDIDAEIKKRVEEAGGMHGGVDVRFSLIWHNRNDLDLHVVAPSGEQIFYSHKHSGCGGALDIDRNVHGETIKPIENIRWPKGKAPKGKYKVFVQTYRFYENREDKTSFRVEADINGKVTHFDGVASGKSIVDGNSQVENIENRANIYVGEFDYDPDERSVDDDAYANYNDELIKRQWASVIPSEHILIIDDPKAVVDVMLGALALTEGTSDLDGYLVDMSGRGQTLPRQDETRKALDSLANTTAIAKVETSNLPPKDFGKKRGGKSEKL